LNFISLECSSKLPSVSVFLNDKHICREQIIESTSSALPLYIDEILKKNSISINDMDYIATTIGPGTFTGIRVGLSFSQGLAYSLKIPITPINTIEVLNNQVKIDKEYIVGMHSHKDFIICKYFNKINKNSIKLEKIGNLKNHTIFGVGLDKFKNEFNYHPLELTSLEIGKYSIKKYQQLVENNISSIKPIYLNEYKTIAKI
tara:strand:+ start:146 stop:751 length:606 start_codon:yes stop_codon:yes gene_type:complete